MSTKALCVLMALLMVGVWGVKGTAQNAGAASPLAAPSNLGPDGISVAANPKFTWTAVPGATYYKVSYPNSAGNGTVVTNTYSNSFSPPTELPLGSVTWSVLANNGVDGATSTATFTKEQSNAPTLTCPGPVVNYPSQAPTFNWTPVPGVKTYTLKVSSSSTVPDPPAPATQAFKTQATSFTLNAGQSDGQTFYAQVSGQTPSGLNTAPSAICSYQVVWSTAATNLNDAQPVLLSPKNGSQHLRDVLLKWQPLNGAARYELQVSSNGDWTNNLLYDIVTDSTVWSPAKTLNNSSYYWRVRGLDNAGNASRWSDYPSNSAGDAWEFTIDPLAAPTRVSPVDNATISNPNFLLSWDPVPGAGAYELQVSTSASFSGAGVNQTCFTTHTDWSPYVYENPPGNPSPGPAGSGNGCRMNQKDQSALTAASTLYWHVRAIDNYTRDEVADPYSTTLFTQTNLPPTNGSFFSVWSSTGKFFFNSDSPTPLGPLGGSVTVPTMSWTRVAGAEYYNVLVTTSPWQWNKGTQSCEAVTGSSTRTYKTAALSMTPSLLPSLRKYNKPSVPGPGLDDAPCPVTVTWTVQSVDHSMRPSPLPYASTFLWSGYTSTSLSATPDPVAPSPASGATVNTTPTFKWKPVAGADHYEVWWFDNPTGSVHTNLIDYNNNVGSNLENPMTESFTPVQPLPVTVTADNPTGYGAWQIAAIGSDGAVHSLSARQNLVVTPPTQVTITKFTTRQQDGTAVDCTSGCSMASTPLISWTGNPDASYYRVFIAVDENFTNVVRTYDTSSTSIRSVEALPDVQAGQSYFVFVQPSSDDWYSGPNSVGTINGAYNSQVIASQRWSFRKQSNAVTGLKTLSPTSPVSGASTNACDDAPSLATVSDVPTFCWNTSQSVPYSSGDIGAMQYHIQISDKADFSNIIDQAWVDQSSYTPYRANYNTYRPGSTITPPSQTAINDLTYPDVPLFWRVQAVDGTNNGLTYSATQSVSKLSNKVIVQSPAAGATVGTTPSLRWTAKPFAAKYNVEVYKNGDTAASPSNLVFGKSTDLTAVTPNGNNQPDNGNSLPAGTYAWRVRGVDAKGNTATWSDFRLFTVDPTVTTPLTLLTPSNGQSFTSQAPVAYSWTPVAGAVSYQVYASSTSSTPKSNSNLSNRRTVMTSYAPETAFPATPPLGNIYWQVDALDSQNAVLATSTIGSFKFNGNRPTATTPNVVPGDQFVNLGWTASAVADVGPILSYLVTAYSNNIVVGTQTVSFAAAGSLTNASYRYTGLTNSTNYQFTITPYDANGPGTESNRSGNTMPNRFAPYSSSTNCVRGVWNDLLGFNPSQTQMQPYINTVNGGQTCAYVAQQLWNSGGFQSVAFPIARLYQAYFLRIPDYDGINYWQGMARTRGTSLNTISAYFALSGEFVGRYGTMNNAQFLTQVYINVMGRVADAGGYAYWLDLMNRGRIGRGSIMLLFSGSAEYSTVQNPRIKAELLFIEFLRRTPTTAEVNTYAARLPNGSTESSDLYYAIRDIMGTQEYAARAH